MADKVSVQFFYNPPRPTERPGLVITSSVDYVDLPRERDTEEWEPRDVVLFAEILRNKIRELGDPGPFSWRMVSVDYDDGEPGRETVVWSLNIKGHNTVASPAFLLRDGQVPPQSRAWMQLL